MVSSFLNRCSCEEVPLRNSPGSPRPQEGSFCRAWQDLLQGIWLLRSFRFLLFVMRWTGSLILAFRKPTRGVSKLLLGEVLHFAPCCVNRACFVWQLGFRHQLPSVVQFRPVRQDDSRGGPLSEWISVKEAAEYTGYTPSHIRLLLRKGLVKGQRFGRDWFTTKKRSTSIWPQIPSRVQPPRLQI